MKEITKQDLMAKQSPRRRRSVDWRAGILAGVIAGAAFMILEMLMVPLFGYGSPWVPPRMIAAIVLGQDVLSPPADFDIAVMIAATAVHFILSIVYGVIVGFIIHRLKAGVAVFAGAVFGILLYLVNFYWFTEFFPWFANARNWITIFTHIIFGVVAAWTYRWGKRPEAELG